jgi:N-acetylmuramoyl-L-alanine amidase
MSSREDLVLKSGYRDGRVRTILSVGLVALTTTYSMASPAAEHVDGPGCVSHEEDIGTVRQVVQPADIPMDTYQSTGIADQSPEDMYCPEGSSFSSDLRLCVTETEAIGPFPPAMQEKCAANGGGPACGSQRWNKKFAAWMRGQAACPAGTATRPSGFCAQGADVYGPFTKAEVDACRKANGGEACTSLRWSAGFADQLSIPFDPAKPLRGLSVSLDSGHGGNPEGWEPGVVSPYYKQVTDYAFNLATTTEVTDYLRTKGAAVKLNQYQEPYSGPELEGKGEKARGTQIFVSVHYNGSTSGAQGSEVYVHTNLASPTDQKLAVAIQQRLVSQIWNGSPAFNRGVKSADFGVLRGAAPIVSAAVLVEGFFIDNSDGLVVMESRRFLSARAIAEGIANYWLSR